MTSTPTRRDFLKSLAFGTAAVVTPGCRHLHANRSTSYRRPNILLIVSDDQGYHDLGCYGNSGIKTPNLDRLAREGVRLTNFYVSWPACTPSRGSLLTGRYPQRNGTYDMFRNDKVDFDYVYSPEEYAVSPEMIGGMDEREILLPRLLKSGGYTSGIFGKWDLGQLRRFLPLQRGFDEFYGFANTGIDYWTHERYDVPSMRRGNDLTLEDQGTYATDLFKREALRFIDRHRNGPFFCYVPFNAPHAASSLNRPRPGPQAPLEYIQKHYGPYDLDNADTDDGRSRRHKACVTYMDEAIGEILARLGRHGLAENTIVVFLSDNGASRAGDNAPLRGWKAQVWEGGIRVPCVVKWPGKFPAGTVCEEFLSSMEIFPTLCRAAGVKPPTDVILDGFDMTPVLAGENKSSRREMFWKRRGDRAARVGSWKWVESAHGSGLFNLSADPGEQQDLSEKQPDQLERMKARFAAWMREMEQAEPRGPFRDF